FLEGAPYFIPYDYQSFSSQSD
ncbi:uncharacterized protein METZ01_LOCUS412521, partial [marine metagenome]